MSYEITLQELSEQPTVVVRSRVADADLDDFCRRSLPAVRQALRDQRVVVVGPPFARVCRLEGLVDVEVGLPVSGRFLDSGEIVSSILPAGIVQVTTHRGPRERMSEAYRALAQWRSINRFVRNGKPWESSHWDDSTQDGAITTLVMPVRRVN